MYKHDFIYCGGEYFRGSVISILHFSAAQIGTSHSLYKIKPKECLSILGLVLIVDMHFERKFHPINSSSYVSTRSTETKKTCQGSTLNS